jgi:single-strand DNA-binding protein
MNQLLLIGNTGKDPVVTETALGMKICKFSVSTNKKFKGEKETTWHNIVAFGKQAEVLGQYLKKGTLIAINGEQQHRSYDKDGETKYYSEVLLNNFEFLGSRGDSESDAKDAQSSSAKATPPNLAPQTNTDDEIPF